MNDEINVKVYYPTDLPVTKQKEEIIKLIKKHQVVIIAGDTGSGDSFTNSLARRETAIHNLLGLPAPRRENPDSDNLATGNICIPLRNPRQPMKFSSNVMLG